MVRSLVCYLFGCCLLLGCSKSATTTSDNQLGAKGQTESSVADNSIVDETPNSDPSDSTSFVLHSPVPEGQLRELAKVSSMATFELQKGNCSKEELLECLAAWKYLKRLRLEECEVDDETLHAISALQQLEVLNIPNGKFTDKGLAELADLPVLYLLRFGSRNVSDQGIAHLANAPSLRFLHLFHVPITDVGLVAFHPMKQLESFYIDGGMETENGIRDLLKANPKLHFHRNQLHVEDDPNSDGH